MFYNYYMGSRYAPVCSIANCAKPHKARGWCGMHYRRWQTHGDVHANVRRYVNGDNGTRFWAYVDKISDPNGCWLWTGGIRRCLSPTGKTPFWYGTFQIVNADGEWQSVSAHRYGYELLIGPIPDGKWIDHVCRNTLCVRPDQQHCEPVPPRTNTVRGYAPPINAARQLSLTHCKRGHPLSGANIRIDANGARVCRACKTLLARKYRAARRAAATGQ